MVESTGSPMKILDSNPIKLKESSVDFLKKSENKIPEKETGFLMLIENHLQNMNSQPKSAQIKHDPYSAQVSLEPLSAEIRKEPAEEYKDPPKEEEIPLINTDDYKEVIPKQFYSNDMLTNSTKASDSFEVFQVFPKKIKTLFPKEWPEQLKPEKSYIAVRKPAHSFLENPQTLELINQVRQKNEQKLLQKYGSKIQPIQSKIRSLGDIKKILSNNPQYVYQS